MGDGISLDGLSAQQIHDLLPPNLIFLGYRGSISHGMFVPSSDPKSIDDRDVMGVFAGPIRHYLGFGGKEVREKWIGEWDAVHYEVRKFISLLSKANPNVLGNLWLPGDMVLFHSDTWKMLTDNRHLFAAKNAYHSFTGYAHGQAMRMTRLNDEAKADLEELAGILRKAGHDPEHLAMTQRQRAALHHGGRFDAVQMGEIGDRYKGLKARFLSGGYMGEKRKNLVKELGYDAKNAAHLIRLLRMGIEFLGDGEMRVKRKDADELLAIKRGDWTLDAIKEEADRLFSLAKEAVRTSPLPDEPDRARIETLCCEIVAQYHRITIGSH